MRGRLLMLTSPARRGWICSALPGRCGNCGPVNSGGAGFCSSCGANLGVLSCGSCGAQQKDASARFCNRCGKPLSSNN
ncbi:MAG: zinc ribbon domain-containing protein [Pyrinomonadaceae bacterium]